MNIKEYRDKCFKIAKAPAVYLKTRSRITGMLQEGRLVAWHEINDKETLLDISFSKGREIYDITEIVSWVKDGREYDWPKRPTEQSDLFGAVSGNTKVRKRSKKSKRT